MEYFFTFFGISLRALAADYLVKEPSVLIADINSNLIFQVKRVGGSPIASVNHKAGDSVIHVVDSLILTGTRSLFNTIKAYPELKSFEKYICRSCIESYIADNGQVTVFAPTNDALAAMPDDVRTNLLSSHVALKDFLLQHMHKGLLFTKDLKVGLEYGVRPLKGKIIRLKKTSSTKVTLNGDSQILVQNIRASDGILHIISKIVLA